MALVVVAYPKIDKNDFEWIQDFRKENDELYFKVIKPHFTLVFPIFDYEDKNRIIEHIENVASQFTPITFNLSSVEENKDAFNEYWHTFLTPSDGYQEIVSLHDKLYEGVLKKELREDIPFVPHLGIGNNKDRAVINKQIKELEQGNLHIVGEIDSLDICEYDDKVTSIRKILL